MRNVPSPENLTLKVEDFGPIIEAEIDLRPLTVFAGPSNTGKSWLAILIYALHRHVEEMHTPHLYHPSRRNKISKKEIDEFIDSILSDIPPEENHDSGSIGKTIDLPDFVVNAISQHLDNSKENLADQICLALGIEDRRHLIRHSTRQHQASISLTKKPDYCDGEYLNQSFIFKGDKFEMVKNEFPKKTFIDDLLIEWISDRIHVERENSLDSDDFSTEYARLFHFIEKQCIASWIDPLSQSVSYLPAGRAGIMRANRSIISAVIRDAASSVIRPTSSLAQLTGSLADFLEQMINIDSHSYRRRKSFSHPIRSDHTMRDHSMAIEKNIIDGEIEVTKSPHIDYPEIAYRPKGWKRSIPLLSTSSMISELAPIVLFIRHKVTKGSVLIIEEPESHLHPKMQVELTQQIAALVESGVRVILTTHSDWVLQTIANMVCASDLTDKQRANIPTAKIALDEKQVGIWLFKQKKSPKGSVVNEMALDRESGLYDSDYDAITEGLYGDSTSIYNEIQRRLSA